MFVKEYLSKGFFTVFTCQNFHLFFLFFSIVFLLLVNSFFLDSFNLSSKVFTCSFPVIRSFLKNFCTSLHFLLFLFIFLLFHYSCLFLVDKSLCLRIKLFSFTHKDQLASLSMFFKCLSVKLSSTALRAFNQIRLTWHWFFNIFFFNRLIFIENYWFFRLYFSSLS